NNSKIDILSNTEISKIKEYCSQNDGYISFAVELCLSLGIRIGELCALQVSDFNFEKGFLTINKSVQRVKNISVNSSKTKVIISSPKTNFSERQIPLPKDLTNKILMYFNEHSLKDNDFLFCSKKGKQLDVRTIQKNFSSMLKKCGIRPVKFHILRHTFATMWVNKNLNVKALSEILGHSNINTTLSLYVHPSIDAKREMMNVFYSAG
ncbi:MAG: site-specific integrase, partial [Firmicutes bacterium]|nr:site-specific integrase [Bacillota bacterium]